MGTKDFAGWQIFLYENRRGERPVETFIKSLQKPTQAKLIREIDLLETHGPELSMPHSKNLGGGLYELRVLGRQNVRLFYGWHRGNIYILHGFVKKTAATPSRELELAKNRYHELTDYNS